MISATAPGGPAAPPPGGWPERLLRPFADVQAGEAPQLLLLALNVFLLLGAYYVMKPVREALILAQPGGAEIKSYAIAVQALLFIPMVWLYGALAARMARRRLINVVTLFFIGCLPVFYVLARSGVSVGIAFLLWIGVFSLMVVAQFWAFAADLYTPEAGKRLFALIAFGASSGAVAGAFVCRLLIGAIGVYPLLLVAAGILAVSLGVFNLVERLARRAGGSAVTAASADRPIGEGNPFAIVFRHRYLTLVALLVMVLNWVNSTGEYMLGSTVAAAGAQEIAAGHLRAEEHGAFIGHFYAGYFQAINVVGMVLQLFVVSRVIAYLGLPVALCLMPLVALACYGSIAMAPFLAVLRWGRTTERAIDYSLQNTVSQILYLPTSRADKYKAKQAIDTFFVRAGDVLSAGTVLVGSGMLALGPAGFALINAVLVLVWLALAVAVGREFARRVPAPGAAADGPEGQPMSHQTPSRQYGALGALAIVLLCPALAAAGDSAGSGARGDRGDLYRAYNAQMKGDPRGPFSAVKRYCKDGSVLPPRPNTCSGRGGGQHGEWSDRTRELRAQGYKVATFLAGLDAAAAVAAPDLTDTYTQLLIASPIATEQLGTFQLPAANRSASASA